jgi:23S rRNA (guanine2445-N2)-methyltransferase / 23S rRNA (guanine2069-N7)-methyltransferase
LYNGRIECTYFQFHGPKPVVNRAADDASSDEAKERPYVHASGSAAFGQLGDKATHQAELFSVRLKKRAKHLRRWPSRRGVTCFRVYERDVPEIPLVVDRYEDYLHITEYERPHDRDPAEHANWLDLMAETAGTALEIPKQNVFLKRRGRQRGKTQHSKVADTGQQIEVHEGGLKFLVNLSDYVDTGLFLDHRITRQMVRDAAQGTTFLNLFAYTGSFSVYAAAGGAKRTVSVDLSKAYLDWAWQNMRLNGFDGNEHKFVTSDVAEFIRRHSAGEMYDLVVFDPPTFSNSKRTEEDWNVQTDAIPLLVDLLPLVRKGGVIYFSSNFRQFKFDPKSIPASEVHEISNQTLPEDFRNRRIHRCWRIVR